MSVYLKLLLKSAEKMFGGIKFLGSLPNFQNVVGISDDLCHCCRIFCPFLTILSDHIPQSQITPPPYFPTPRDVTGFNGGMIC